MQPQAEAVVAEVELVRLTQVDLEEAVAILHVQVLQEMQVVILHLKDRTVVLQLTQVLTAVVAVAVIRQLVQVMLENLEVPVVVEQQIQFQVHL